MPSFFPPNESFNISGTKWNKNGETIQQRWFPSLLTVSPNTYKGANADVNRAPLQQTTHLCHLTERGFGFATSSWLSPSNFCVPPGAPCDQSRGAGAPRWARRPLGSTTLPEIGTGCGTGTAKETERTSWKSRGSASRTVRSACTSSGGAFWNATCSSSGTTTDSSRGTGTASRFRKTSGSWRPRTVGWTGPTGWSRNPPAASPATNSRNWTWRLRLSALFASKSLPQV